MSFFEKFNESYQRSFSDGNNKPGDISFQEKFLRFFKHFLRFLFGVGDPPLMDLPFPRQDIEKYYHLTSDKSGGEADCQTIRDLDLVKYIDQFFPKISVFGQQILYSRVRGGIDDDEASLAKTRFTLLIEDQELLEHLENICKPLREVVTEVSEFLLVGHDVHVKKWIRYLWVLPAISILSLLLTALHWSAILVFALSFLLSIYIQIITYNEISQWEPKRIALNYMMKAADNLAASRSAQNGNSFTVQFQDQSRSRREVADFLRPSRLESYVPWIGEYADWFLLKNIIRHYNCVGSAKANKQILLDVFSKVGNLEADIAVARHLSRCKRYCWVERHDKNKISMAEVVNPFLVDASPISITFGEKGIFLSGQNGVGKSTFLRTIGINMVVARAFGFCYARYASFLTCPVYTSIQNEDSLSDGESLYMSELRRAKELLVTIDGPGKGVYIIDEIFRGTNHLESVAVASAFLNALARKAIVVISSHNLVLAPLLQNRLDALCIRRSVDDVRKVIIEPGVLADPNGISLMERYGFGNEIYQQARDIHRWLGDYMAHPEKIPDLL